jgi:hypothetical protein
MTHHARTIAGVASAIVILTGCARDADTGQQVRTRQLPVERLDVDDVWRFVRTTCDGPVRLYIYDGHIEAVAGDPRCAG